MSQYLAFILPSTVAISNIFKADLQWNLQPWVHKNYLVQTAIPIKYLRQTVPLFAAQNLAKNILLLLV